MAGRGHSSAPAHTTFSFHNFLPACRAACLQEPNAVGWQEEEASEAPGPRGGTLVFWGIALVNISLAVAAVLFLRFLSGAERYLLNDPSEFGPELETAQTGISLLRIAGYALTAGFLLAALGMISRRRVGRVVQFLWALLLCLTLVGAIYGVPILIALMLPSVRARFAHRAEPAS